MMVFLVSGLWHAGLGYGIGLGLSGLGRAERSLSVGERALALGGDGQPCAEGHARGRLYGGATLLVFHLVLVSWVFFRAAEIWAMADGDLRRIGSALPEIPGLMARYPFTPSMPSSRRSSSACWRSRR